MPTYEYACGKCGASYELREGFDAPTLHACQECGKGKAKRVLYAPPVVFKGGGWYVTDSRGKKAARVDSSDAGESGGAGADAGGDAATGGNSLADNVVKKPAASSKPSASGSAAAGS